MPVSYDARSVFSLFSMKYMGSCSLNRKYFAKCDDQSPLLICCFCYLGFLDFAKLQLQLALVYVHTALGTVVQYLLYLLHLMCVFYISLPPYLPSQAYLVKIYYMAPTLHIITNRR